MSVKVVPNSTDQEVQKIHPLNYFLVGLSKLGVLQTEFKLLSGKTLILVFWSLFPLLSIVYFLNSSGERSDIVVTFSSYACNLLITFWDAIVPCCLVYFFSYNPAIAVDLSYLPAPKKMCFLIITDIVGAVYGGYLCYSSIVELSNPGIEESFFLGLLLICNIYDIVLKFCFTQLLGSIVEKFQQLSLSLESTQFLQLSFSNNSYRLAVKRSMDAVSEYSKIKRGLGPLLFVTITTNMIIVITAIFLILRESYATTNFIFSLSSLFVLFYLIQVCDDAHEALINMVENTRQFI
jgi:hypothetical protein